MSALPAIPLLIPLATHIASFNGCVSRDHRHSSAITLVRNVPGLKAAILAFRDDVLHVKDRARATSMLSQVQLFFVDNAFFQKLLDIPEVPAAIAQIHDAVDLSNPDGIASLTGFLQLYRGLKTLQAQQAAAARESAKAKAPPRKRIVKSPKMVESDTDSEGELRFVGIKRKANSTALESPSEVKRFKPGVPSFEPGSSAAALLLSKVDTLLAAGGTITHLTLVQYLELLDKTTRTELFALDISRQICHGLLQRHESIQQLLASSDPLATNVSLAQLTALAPAVTVPPIRDEDTVMAKVPSGST
ncbi:hypothetical protein H0H92_005003 [Tricholoma furcatifolium]|nr:hypothetical protein H0H92_005003 [Tricholoma furcatifolium]